MVGATPACCCGTPIKAGPPGVIAGKVVFANGMAPGAVAVYAFDIEPEAIHAHGNYLMTHVDPPATAFTLSAPPGYYKVVARLDSDPLTAGAHASTYSVMVPVPVQANQTVTGVDITSWRTEEARWVLWNIDTMGSPLSTTYPAERTLPTRQVPAPTPPDTTSDVRTRSSGVRLRLPSSWHVLHYPNADSGNTDFYASEDVQAPLQLDNSGILLAVRWDIGQACPLADFRYATAKARIGMQGGARDFYFEDPTPQLGGQPFTGYLLHGGRISHGDCIELYFTGRTEAALESNLGLIESIINSATFGPRTD